MNVKCEVLPRVCGEVFVVVAAELQKTESKPTPNTRRLHEPRRLRTRWISATVT
jgi:hypothetical protein